MDVSSPTGILRTWSRAVRNPWLAAASGAACAVLAALLLRLVFGPVDSPSTFTGVLMVAGPATVIATLPHTTVQFRVASLLVSLLLGPLSYAPPQSLGFGAFIDSFASTVGDPRGVRVMFLWWIVSLPVLEVIGAWVRRRALVQEATGRGGRPRAWS